MDITAHQLTGTHHLVSCQSTTNGKSFVHANKTLNPRINEQVVTNTNLHSSGITVVYQHHIQKSRVEYDITMIGKERVTVRLINGQSLILKGTAIGMFTNNMSHDRFHETLLEVERCLDTRKGQSKHAITDNLRQPRSKTFQHPRELTVIN